MEGRVSISEEQTSVNFHVVATCAATNDILIIEKDDSCEHVGKTPIYVKRITNISGRGSYDHLYVSIDKKWIINTKTRSVIGIADDIENPFKSYSKLSKEQEKEVIGCGLNYGICSISEQTDLILRTEESNRNAFDNFKSIATSNMIDMIFDLEFSYMSGLKNTSDGWDVVKDYVGGSIKQLLNYLSDECIDQCFIECGFHVPRMNRYIKIDFLLNYFRRGLMNNNNNRYRIDMSDIEWFGVPTNGNPQDIICNSIIDDFGYFEDYAITVNEKFILHNIETDVFVVGIIDDDFDNIPSGRYLYNDETEKAKSMGFKIWKFPTIDEIESWESHNEIIGTKSKSVTIDSILKDIILGVYIDTGFYHQLTPDIIEDVNNDVDSRWQESTLDINDNVNEDIRSENGKNN